MFKALFNVIINLLASVVQIVCWPVNEVIKLALPDVSEKILQVTNSFNTIFDCMSWAIGLLHPIVIGTLLFIVAVEIAKHTIFTSTHNLLKVWNLFQKLKFW